MRKDELVQSVRDYINDDKADYAVLIDGVWGCGKTYLYENELKKEISNLCNGRKKRKCNVYISLYGISSVEQLSKELVTDYILESKLRGNVRKKKIYEHIKTAAGIISKVSSFSVKGLSVNLDNGIKQIKKAIQFSDMVICFDDFERCSIPIVDLFGIINNLVEHCNCKVIILADEDNIGKIYANTNVELKYATLLQNRKIVDNVDAQGQEIGIEDLKQLNEKVYSDNYIYRDIKEKVIGLSLVYTPDLKEEFDSVINSVVSDDELKKKVSEEKDKILEYMSDCDNNNIRIMKSWLIKFEKIYKVLIRYFLNEVYFDEVFDRFANYSIRVACAIGKNQKLPEWKDDSETGCLELAVPSPKIERYRFIDDLYKNSLFSEARICQAAKRIISEKHNEEKERKKEELKQEAEKENLDAEKKAQKYRRDKVLEKWYYLEDEEIKSYLENLVNDINSDEYAAQDYQRIIAMLAILVKYELCEEGLLENASQAMICKIEDAKGIMDVEKYQYDFLEDKVSSGLYHKYYDNVYSLIIEKNKELSDKNISQVFDYSTGETFYNSCKENYNEFLSQKSFISFVNFEHLIGIIRQGKIKDVYDINRGFNRVYDFSNIYEYYSGDLEQLKLLKETLEQIDCSEKTRKIAVQTLTNTLNSKIKLIKNEF